MMSTSQTITLHNPNSFEIPKATQISIRKEGDKRGLYEQCRLTRKTNDEVIGEYRQFDGAVLKIRITVKSRTAELISPDMSRAPRPDFFVEEAMMMAGELLSLICAARPV